MSTRHRPTSVTRPVIGLTTQTLHSIDGIPTGLPQSWVMNQRYFLRRCAGRRDSLDDPAVARRHAQLCARFICGWMACSFRAASTWIRNQYGEDDSQRMRQP